MLKAAQKRDHKVLSQSACRRHGYDPTFIGPLTMSQAWATGSTVAPEPAAYRTISSKKPGLHPNRLDDLRTSCVANISQPHAFEFLSIIAFTESASCVD